MLFCVWHYVVSRVAMFKGQLADNEGAKRQIQGSGIVERTYIRRNPFNSSNDEKISVVHPNTQPGISV